MEPRIRFCTTCDGVHIAYAVLGQGLPLLVTPNSWDGLRFRLENSAHRHFHQRLAERRTLVCYDRRGVGLSDRERKDFTIEEDVRDVYVCACRSQSYPTPTGAVEGAWAPSEAYVAKSRPHGDSTSQRS